MKIKLTEDQRKFINIFDIENKGDKFHFSGSYYFIMTLEDSGNVFDDIGNEPITKQFLESQGWDYSENYADLPILGFLNEKLIDKKLQYLLYLNPENNSFSIERIFDCGTGIEDYLFNGFLFKVSDYFQLIKFLNIE